MNKIGVDTNIFIYTLDSSSPYHDECLNFLQDTDNELYTTTKNISEFIAVSTKLKIDRDKMNGFYNEIKQNVTILYPNTKSLQTFEMLNEKYQPSGNRVFDLEIASVLITHDIGKLATKNIDDFKRIIEISLVNFDKYKFN